jgi:hypothetical protein
MGRPRDVASVPESATGRYLAEAMRVEAEREAAVGA